MGNPAQTLLMGQHVASLLNSAGKCSRLSELLSNNDQMIPNCDALLIACHVLLC